MANKSLFKVRNLKKSFGDNDVLRGISFEVKKDSSLVILGGSGSGKSVLIKSMIGLLEPDCGSVLYNGQEITYLGIEDRLEILKECGYLFQTGALFDSLTVENNITFFARKLYSLTKEDALDLAIKKLRSVGLSEKIVNLYPSELSGGMQKRVALARAICTNPKVIFFDEPTTGLDPIMSNVINDLIVKVREELGVTTITITHDMNSLRYIAKEVAYLHEGKIQWTGDINEISNSEDKMLTQFISGNLKGPLTV